MSTDKKDFEAMSQNLAETGAKVNEMDNKLDALNDTLTKIENELAEIKKMNNVANGLVMALQKKYLSDTDTDKL